MSFYPTTLPIDYTTQVGNSVNITPQGAEITPLSGAGSMILTPDAIVVNGIPIDPLNLTALAPNIIPTELVINNNVIVQDNDTTPNNAISIEAGVVGIGTNFGIEYSSTTNQDLIIQTTSNNSGGVLFKQFGLGSTTTQTKINQGVIVSSDTANPNAITINPAIPSLTITDGTNTNTITATSAGVPNTLNEVLTAGNTATGVNAKIGLTDSGVGGSANPQLTLNNSNATAGNTNGVPLMEYYKSGRIVVANDIIASQRFNANNYLGTKTPFGRIDCVATSSSAPAGDDGALDFYTCVNGTSSLVMRLNGADNENNTFRPFDLNGNNLKTSSGNMTIETLASTGTGDIFISPKVATGVVKISKDIQTDNSITTLTTAGGSSISLGGATPDYRFNIDADTTEHYWNDGTDQSTITLDNDFTSKNNTINQYYQSPAGNIQTIIQSIPSVQRIQQIDGILNRTAEYSPTKIALIADSGASNISIENKVSSVENRISLFKNQGGGIYCSSGIVNNNGGQQLFLSNTDNANQKSITISTDPTGVSAITHSNTRDANPFAINTDTDLVIESTKGGGSALLKSANGVEIEGTNSVVLNATAGTGGSITLGVEDTAGDLILTSTNLERTSSGGSSGKYLRIKINGTYYRLALDTD